MNLVPFTKKVIRKVSTHILIKNGYPTYSAYKIINETLDDLFENTQDTLKQKIWAYKRGFLSSNIKDYGLTDMNYKLFLSNFEYYRLHPLNGEFSHWIDDKITTKYILNSFNEYFPKYYYHLKKPGKIIPLMDIDTEYQANTESIIELLKKEGNLALKLVSGELSNGFYKISYIDKMFFINNNAVDEDKMIQFLFGLENYFVTEYITAHHEISRIYSTAANTLRVMVINEDGQTPVIANGFMRFGTKKTGFVADNGSAQGVYTIIDVKSGRFYDAIMEENHHVFRCEMHPDTKIKVEGILPHWEFIKTKLIEISSHLSELTWIGFDVVVTEESFKILEINSLQDVTTYQCYYPLLINNEAAPYFKKLINKKSGNN